MRRGWSRINWRQTTVRITAFPFRRMKSTAARFNTSDEYISPVTSTSNTLATVIA
jgi:hypothetical protein